ncbi:TetR/AcrR family transcriptional regulator [Microvirga pakistanensis]|uniref:TetR/AcrR family transcriptional regulator n=1 Tax=Microvirga pakistanensis TaxID=1682650 RepID=UPI00106A9DDF|nr:TetR/AcrR family transcriptional regulator [Microvirga pakistanensis]
MNIAITRKSERRRAEIIDAAIRHFNRSGLNGATLGGIAASVGMVTNGVAYYYRRKEDLAAACMIQSLAELVDIIGQAVAVDDPALRLERLLAAWFARLADGVTGKATPVMVFNDIRALTPPQSNEVFPEYYRLFRVLRGIFNGTSIGGDPVARNARTHLLLSILHAAQEWFVAQCEARDHARVAARLALILKSGLGGVAPQIMLSLPDPDPDADPMRVAYLRAATRLINQHGYRGTSVERIAGELNLTKGSFYHHIDAKDDLVTACFERTFAVLRQAQDLGFESSGNGAERLATTVGALLGWQLSEAGPMLRISAYNSLPESIRPTIRHAGDRLVERFAWQISDAQADGSMPVRDAIIGARVLHSMLNAVIELEWWVSERGQARALPHYTLALFSGLFAPLAGED